jgi:hypothetical protein
MRGENFVAHLDGLGGTPVAHHWLRLWSSGLLGHIVLWLNTIVSEEHAALILTVEVRREKLNLTNINILRMLTFKEYLYNKPTSPP